MTDRTLAERLGSLPGLAGIPRDELEWLAANGGLERFEVGVMVTPDEKIEDLYIVLSGRVVVNLDRGVGPRRVMEWSAGGVTGLLPFSRMERVPSDMVTELPTEALALHEGRFPEMFQHCPEFTAFTVHLMIDRARRFNTSDLQDEKMISLGRLAAGLAHELNNPASATMRGSRTLSDELPDVERASRALARAGLSEEAIVALERVCTDWLEPRDPAASLDWDLEVRDWLAARSLGSGYLDRLAHTSVSVDRLDELADLVPGDALGAALDWVAAGSAVRLAASNVGEASKRIYDLVEGVKGFTHMDQVSEPGPVDVEAGLHATVEVLASRVSGKGVHVTVDAAPDVPAVWAVGSDLNQVWTKLLDNALDAVGQGGHIRITVGTEPDRVVVRVIDDGPGIAPEHLSRVFDPFFTTKAPGEGMGLGLETARQLLRRYGGEIAVDSEPGRTEFSVRLRTRPPGREASD